MLLQATKNHSKLSVGTELDEPSSSSNPYDSIMLSLYLTFFYVHEDLPKKPIKRVNFLCLAFRGLVRITASKGASGMSNPNTRTCARDRWT